MSAPRYRRTILAALVALSVGAAAACTPAKPAAPPPPAPGSFLAGYWIWEDPGARAVAPLPFAYTGTQTTYAQALAADGSVALTIGAGQEPASIAQNGFHTVAVPLGAIDTVAVAATVTPAALPGEVRLGLWLDTAGDGNYFDFVGGGSMVASRPGQHIDDDTSLFVQPHTCCGFGQLTFGQLKGGLVPGIDGATPAVVVVWFLRQFDDPGIGNGTAVVSELRVNDVDLLVP